MTLKEQIKECKKIIAQLKKDIGSFEASSVIDNAYEEDIKRFTNYLDFYKDILNSLKVLEILKKIPFEMYENGGGDSWNWYIDIKQSTILTEEEKEKIKEWLEEK